MALIILLIVVWALGRISKRLAKKTLEELKRGGGIKTISDDSISWNSFKSLSFGEVIIQTMIFVFVFQFSFSSNHLPINSIRIYFDSSWFHFQVPCLQNCWNLQCLTNPISYFISNTRHQLHFSGVRLLSIINWFYFFFYYHNSTSLRRVLNPIETALYSIKNLLASQYLFS